MVQDSTKPKTQREFLIEKLSQFGAFNQEVDTVRTERPKNPALTKTDESLRFGTEKDRLAVILENVPGMFPVQPDMNEALASQYGMDTPALNQRIAALSLELPPADTSEGGMLGFLGKAVGHAGNAVGLVLQGLALPAEGTERLVGMLYFNDVVNLADRWHMAAITYDTMYNDAFHNGTQGRGDALFDYWNNTDLDEIEEKYADGIGNFIGQLMLDPLWLVGPVIKAPAIASKIPFIGGILGSIGKSKKAALLDDSLRQMDTVTQKTWTEYKDQSWLTKLVTLTPNGLVGEEINAFNHLFSNFNDPAFWGSTGTLVRNVMTDIHAGRKIQSSALGSFFESTQPIVNVKRGLQGNDALMKKINGFSSLGEINPRNAFWADAEHLLKVERDGTETTILALLKRGKKLTPEEAQTYATYRQSKLVNEFFSEGIPTLFDLHKVTDPGILEGIESFAAAMKTGLSLTVINTPSFVILNWANNAFHIAIKGEDVGAAFSYIGNPIGIGRKVKSLMADMGFSKDLLQAKAADPSFLRESIPKLISADNTNSRWRMAAYAVNIADKTDTGMRLRLTGTGIREASDAVWRFGDGGVLDDLPEELATIPGFKEHVLSLWDGNFADIAHLMDDIGDEAVGANPDALVSFGAILNRWAETDAIKLVLQKTDPQQTSKAAQILKSQVPDMFYQDMDEIIDVLKTGRKLADGTEDPNVLSHVFNKLDDLSDELRLMDWEMVNKGMEAPLTLPMTEIRNVLMPWQDIAHFQRLAQARRVIYSRVLGSLSPYMGGVLNTRVVSGKLTRAHDKYVKEMVENLKAVQHRDLSVGSLRTLASRNIELLDARNKTILNAFHPGSTAWKKWSEIAKIERAAVTKSWARRINGISRRKSTHRRAADVGDWAETLRIAHVEELDDIAKLADNMSVEFAVNHGVSEMPTMGAMVKGANHFNQDIIRFTKENLPAMLDAPPMPTSVIPVAKKYIESLRISMQQRNTVASIHGRAVSEFGALNYSRKYGFDAPLSVIFPYHFWIGRTVRDWARMTLGRPGYTAAFSQIYESITEINEDASLPDRLKRNIRLPAPPGFNEALGGAMYFDPVKVVYPLSAFQDDTDYSRGKDLTAAGQAWSFASQLGPGINPLMTLGLGASGALGERHAHARQGFSALTRAVSPRGIQAINDWMNGISQDPDPEVLTPEVKIRIANEEPFTEGEIKELSKAIWDTLSHDGFNQYRTDRMIASLVAEDPERFTPKMGLEAMRFRTGALYQMAERTSKQNKGLTALSGWLLAPLRIYPDGESIQRGLDSIFRELRQDGTPEARDKFFEAYPEFQLRQLSLVDRDDPDAQLRELDTTLFFIDLGEIEDRFDPHIDRLLGIIKSAEEHDMLETSEGRRLMEFVRNDINLLSQRKEDEIQQLDLMYPHKAVELSLRASPKERGLFELRGEYFNIRRRDYRSFEDFDNARKSFIADLPAEGASESEWLQRAVKAAATWSTAQTRLATATNKGEIVEARDEKLRAFTQESKPLISMDLFQSYLSVSVKAKTPQRIEYERAKIEIRRYFAIERAPGITPDQAGQLQRVFWAGHPLLSKYYGSRLGRLTAETASLYGVMDEIWEGYYDREGDAQSQRTYLQGNLEDLNEARQAVGLPAIKLIDWNQIDPKLLQQTPTDPHEAALQRELDSDRQ